VLRLRNGRRVSCGNWKELGPPDLPILQWNSIGKTDVRAGRATKQRIRVAACGLYVLRFQSRRARLCARKLLRVRIVGTYMTDITGTTKHESAGKAPGLGRRGAACYAHLDGGSKTDLGRFPSPSIPLVPWLCLGMHTGRLRLPYLGPAPPRTKRTSMGTAMPE